MNYAYCTLFICLGFDFLVRCFCTIHIIMLYDDVVKCLKIILTIKWRMYGYKY